MITLTADIAGPFVYFNGRKSASSPTRGTRQTMARQRVEQLLAQWKESYPEISTRTQFKLIPALDWWNAKIGKQADGSVVTRKVLGDALGAQGLRVKPAAVSSKPLDYRRAELYVEGVARLNPRRPIRITHFADVVRRRLNIDIDTQSVRRILINQGLEIRSRGGNARTHVLESYLKALEKRLNIGQGPTVPARTRFITPGLLNFLEGRFGVTYSRDSIKKILEKRGYRWFDHRCQSTIRKLTTQVVAIHLDTIRGMRNIPEVERFLLARTKIPFSKHTISRALEANGIKFTTAVTKRATAFIAEHKAAIEKLEGFQAVRSYLLEHGFSISYQATQRALARAKVTPLPHRRLPPPEHLLATASAILGPQTTLKNVTGLSGKPGEPAIDMPDPKAISASNELITKETNDLLTEAMRWLQQESPLTYPVVQQHHLEGQPLQKVANTLGICEAEAQQRMKTGLALLRRFFED